VSQPTLALSFGRPPAAPQAEAHPAPPAEQPKVTLGDSTNVFETPRFSFGSKPADPKTKKVCLQGTSHNDPQVWDNFGLASDDALP
jgi:hypothetical protein